MSYEDKILFEQYFSAKNIDEDDRNFYLNVISKIRDIDNSIVAVHEDDDRHYELVTLNLTRIIKKALKDNISNYRTEIKFNGAISNKIENRLIDGVILVKGNNMNIITNFYRLYEHLDDDDRCYSTEDTFILSDNNTIRISKYQYDTQRCIEELDPITLDTSDSFVAEKVKSLKLKD